MIENFIIKSGFEVHIRHELEPYEIKALKELKEKKFLEFRGRDADYGGRNTDLNLRGVYDLLAKRYVKYNDDAWHTTVVLTDFGKKIAEELI